MLEWLASWFSLKLIVILALLVFVYMVAYIDGYRQADKTWQERFIKGWRKDE